MNNARRKLIAVIAEQIADLRETLEEIDDEEEEYYEAIPKNLQNSAMAEKSEEAQENLDCAISSLAECADYLEAAQE